MKKLFLFLLFVLMLSCVNYDNDISSLRESIASLEEINEGLQSQIDEIKRQQDEDRLAAERYIETALSSIATLSTLVEDLTSNFINQAANLAVLQVEVEKIEGQISDIESQLELIDSTGDIASVMDLLYDLDDNIVENRYSITSLLNRISSLETESEKYNTDIIGCYYSGDYTFEILPNGIGYYETWNIASSSIIYITFIWEKVSGDDYKFVFPSSFLLYVENIIDGGTYIRTITSDTSDLFFPATDNTGYQYSISYGRVKNDQGLYYCY